MKPLLLFSLLVLISSSSLAQDKYFHELKGIEDSTGATHLFYTFHKTKPGCWISGSYSNNIFHYNTSQESDSVLLKQGASSMQYYDECYNSSNSIIEYEFLENNPELFVYSGVDVQLDPSYYIGYSSNTYIQTGFTKISNIETDNFSDSILFSISQNEVQAHLSFKTPTDASFWEYADTYSFELTDSLVVDYSVSDIHPYVEGIYFQIDEQNGFLSRSSDQGKTYELVETSLINWTNMSEFSFDSSSNFIYSVGAFSDNNFALVKSDSLGSIDSWSIALENETELLFSLDSSEEGSIYLAKNDSVFVSTDHAESFSFIFHFDSEVSGIYKKPASDILYILTINELFQYENGIVTSLKKIPVSNEDESIEIPGSLTLHQNYPNPFNPSTTISFELDQPAQVTLTVFDALGRTISTLINKQKIAGSHRITFDASSLSSGIYFYRLEAEDFIQTKRLTLIK